MKKFSFTYEGKTGLVESPRFQRAGLADLTFNTDAICVCNCTYCFGPSLGIKHRAVQEIMNSGMGTDIFGMTRTKENLLECLHRDLEKIGSDDQRTVLISPVSEPLATSDHLDKTSSAVHLIMEKSNLNVRLISKSPLICDLAALLEEYKNRILYGLSIGTTRPEIVDCLEKFTAPLGERIRILRDLQDNGYRTYGYLSPVSPIDLPKVSDLLDQINPEACERVFVESLNIKGLILAKTCGELRNAGFEDEALTLEQTFGNGDQRAWRDFCMDLFVSFQTEMRQRGLLDKLCFIQYVTGKPQYFKRFFASREGAVCL